MPKFSRMHFKEIASLLKQITPISKRKVEAERYCKMFKADNERFDKDKFLKAAGL
jgi:hypothetical protein